MLVIAQAVAGMGDGKSSGRHADAALRIVQDTLTLSLADEARLAWKKDEEGLENVKEIVVTVEDMNPEATFDAVLKNSTANYNADGRERYWDHGLVDADYYLTSLVTGCCEWNWHDHSRVQQHWIMVHRAWALCLL
jgi:hypothetical protein